MQLTKLTNEPTSYQILRTVEYAGYEIAFAIDLASHELYLRKTLSKRSVWFIIHLFAD